MQSFLRTFACYNLAWVYDPIQKKVVRLIDIPYNSGQTMCPCDVTAWLVDFDITEYVGTEPPANDQLEVQTAEGGQLELIRHHAHAIGFLKNDYN